MTTIGPTRANPYIVGNPATPLIPNLVGGAEAFGISGQSTVLDYEDVLDAAPHGAGVALLKFHVGAPSTDTNFPGYDYLVRGREVRSNGSVEARFNLADLNGRLAANGVPTRLGGRAFSGGSSNELTAVGNLGGSLRGRGVPEALVPRIVAGVREAFALSVAHIFWLGVISSALAFLIVVLVIRDVPLRGNPAPAAEDREVLSPRQTTPLPVPAGVGAGATL